MPDWFHRTVSQPLLFALPDSLFRQSWFWGSMLGLAMLIGSLLALVIASTRVILPYDEVFCGLTRDQLSAPNPRLLPFLAHDRATMGGMLMAAGIPFLLAALWGIGRGTRWLWWTMLLAAVPAYLCAIGVHFVIGYMDFLHLLPAFLGLGFLVAGLMACRAWMWDEGPHRADTIPGSEG